MTYRTARRAISSAPATGIFGKEFVDQVKSQGIKQALSAPRSPWQRAYVERLIGSIRRECLDHVIVVGERWLHQYLSAYADYYHRWRTHLGWAKTLQKREERNSQSKDA